MGGLTSEILNTLAAHPEQVRELGKSFRQPPVDFEKKYGLIGISQYYRLPEGLSSAALDSYSVLLHKNFPEEQGLMKMNEAWDELKELNLILKKINYDAGNISMMYNLLMGVASAFNIRDIQHFISDPRAAGSKMRASAEFGSLVQIFNYASRPAEFGFGWVASPKTIAYIREQAESKKIPPASGILKFQIPRR